LPAAAGPHPKQTVAAQPRSGVELWLALPAADYV